MEIALNYYQDLGARFGLDGPTLKRMEKANVLYDRDEHGEFFQLYSRTFGDGFFFEIVQRCGTYAGYGGPNAPFRVAAQQRAIRPIGVLR